MPSKIIQLVRRASVELLKEYFSFLPPTIKINWNSNNKEILQPLLQAIDSLKRKDKQKVIADAERILIMTDDSGQAALDSVIMNHQIFYSMGNNYQRSLWAFLYDYESFEKAEDIRHADICIKDSSSEGFIGTKGVNILLNYEQITSFEEKIKYIFDIEENIKVQILDCYFMSEFRRCTKSFQVIIHYSNSPANYRAFEEGKIINNFIHPVEDLVITYDPNSGQINIISKSPQCKITIAKAFANTLLSYNQNKGYISLMRYNLDKLRQAYNFITLPEDGIASIKVSHLLFQGPYNIATFAVEVPRNQQVSIYSIAEKIFKNYKTMKMYYKLIRVTLLIRFQQKEANKSGKILSVTINRPNTCELENKSHKDQQLIHKYLKMWGLVEEL
jgi:hypothetical protein